MNPADICSAVIHDPRIAEWVADQLKIPNEYAPCVALGIMRHGELVGGVIFNNYRGHDIHITLAAVSPTCGTRAIIRNILSYPFLQLGCARITALTARKNKRMRGLLVRIGFRLEGVTRKGFDGRQDAMIYGMIKKECKWIKDKINDN